MPGSEKDNFWYSKTLIFCILLIWENAWWVSANRQRITDVIKKQFHSIHAQHANKKKSSVCGLILGLVEKEQLLKSAVTHEMGRTHPTGSLPRVFHQQLSIFRQTICMICCWLPSNNSRSFACCGDCQAMLLVMELSQLATDRVDYIRLQLDCISNY